METQHLAPQTAYSTESRQNLDGIDLCTELDEIVELLESGDVRGGMTALFQTLQRWRDSTSREAWQELVERYCLDHPLARHVFQSPLALHSYSQPRGYPGDAELLDYIYQIKPCSDLASELGRAIHAFLLDTPAARAVRARREILADFVDQAAWATESPRILSIAAGHLREVELSAAVQAGEIDEFIAVDQDPLNLEQIEHDYARYGVRAVCASVRDLLTGARTFADLDLAYAASLYDYLPRESARELTAVMFRALKPGGKLLVANVIPDIDEAGFIESYLSWNLTYRTHEELFGLSERVPLDQMASIRVFLEPNQVFLFLEIEKRA
jgi:extracellular factor (EF) 3-hydroxypalmitic acid methyl ester biosynthesis protein